MNTVSLLIFLFSFSISANADNCDTWFTELKIKPGSVDCERKCSTQLVDMGTFDCPARCDKFCKAPAEESDPLPYLKGLSKGDRAAISKYPNDAYTVYRAKQKADDLTSKVFGKPGRNDESDAFRHFVWAALLLKELGKEKALYFLESHEKDPAQPKAEKEMDVANNARGIEYAETQLKSKQPLELDQIEKAGLEELRENKLKVITPSKKKLPDGYYSK